jgi:hypothetical protein
MTVEGVRGTREAGEQQHFRSVRGNKFIRVTILIAIH